MPKNSSVQAQVHIEMATLEVPPSPQCFTIIVFLIEAVLANNPIAINTNVGGNINVCACGRGSSECFKKRRSARATLSLIQDIAQA